MTLVVDGASTFRVEELTGDQRDIRLTGRALPYRGLELAGTQRNSIEWYNGNPIGVLQVFGSKEEPTVVNGMWKDRFLGDGGGPARGAWATVDGLGVLTARELCDVFNDVRRKGQEIEFTWLDRVRRGIIEKFSEKWDNGHDVTFEIGFAWTSQGESLQDITLASDFNSDLADVPSQMHSITDNIQAGAAMFANGFNEAYSSTVGQIDLAGAAIMATVDELDAAAVGLAQFESIPDSAMRRVGGILDGLKLEAVDLGEALQGNADGARLNIGGPFGKVLADRATIRSQSDIANQTSALAAAQQQKLLLGAKSNVIAIYQAREGDDLRRVSTIYYKTPDEWRGLMVYNHLTSDKLSAGQMVIVPTTVPRFSP